MIALLSIGLWFVMPCSSGVASLGVETAQSGGGVAYWAHVEVILVGSRLAFRSLPN